MSSWYSRVFWRHLKISRSLFTNPVSASAGMIINLEFLYKFSYTYFIDACHASNSSKFRLGIQYFFVYLNCLKYLPSIPQLTTLQSKFFFWIDTSSIRILISLLRIFRYLILHSNIIFFKCLIELPIIGTVSLTV